VEGIDVLSHVTAVGGRAAVWEGVKAAVGAGAADGSLPDVTNTVKVVVSFRAAIAILVTVAVFRDEGAGVAAANDPVPVDVVGATVAVLEAVVVLAEGRALVGRVEEAVAIHVWVAGIPQPITIGVSLVADEGVAGLRRPVRGRGAVV
jgi:hypothetical protein